MTPGDMLLDRIYERRQPLNADLQPVAGADRPDAAGRAGDNDIARQKRHVGGNEADQVEAIEDELAGVRVLARSEEHTSELQSPCNLVCRLLLEKKKKK